MMKRLTYLSLIALLVAANSLLVIGCGCDDDDDDKGDAAVTKDAGNEPQAGTGGGQDAAVSQEDASQEDAEADAQEAPPEYACGGDDATCDLLDETSCDESEGCQFLAPATGNGKPFAQCVEAGTATAGDECDEDNLCAAGFDCNDGFCHKYCCELGSTEQCPADQACIIEILDQSDALTGVQLCDDCDDCNPLTADGCSGGLGCYPIPSTDTDIGCRLCLASSGDKDLGDPCDSANDCNAGSGCYSINDAAAVCTSFCDLTADTDSCAPEGTCTGELLGLASVQETVGLCVPNQ